MSEANRTSNQIVQQLRDHATAVDQASEFDQFCVSPSMLREAADEIERITHYADECREKFNSEYKATQYLLAQVERLSAENDDLVKAGFNQAAAIIENRELRAALEEAVRYMGAVKPDVYARTHAPLLKPPKVTPGE